jgi:putative hemolysin
MRTERIGRRGIVAAMTSAILVIVAAAAPAAGSDPEAARDYCESMGGTVKVRQAAVSGYVDPADVELLAHSVELCHFEADDGSMIEVDLVTLASEEPSLAAQAYLAKQPMAEELTGNPASVLCGDIGGTIGDWVDVDDEADFVVTMCVFADTSMIDEWGIAYYSEDVIRGTDLAPLLGSGGCSE